MIKNLIFDVGNVLVEYRWRDMLTLDYGLAQEEAERIGQETFECRIWDQKLDAGYLDVEGAIAEYGKLFPEDIEHIAWFLRNAEKMAVPRPEIWEKLPGLKEKGYAIYILSNYSQELFGKHTKGASFLDVLDGGIVSYQVHLLKPDRRIYECLLEKYGLRAEECLFFDDLAPNVESARKLGMQAVQVLSREMLNQRLEEL